MTDTTQFAGTFKTDFTSGKKLRKAVKRRGADFKVVFYQCLNWQAWVVELPMWTDKKDFDKVKDLLCSQKG